MKYGLTLLLFLVACRDIGGPGDFDGSTGHPVDAGHQADARPAADAGPDGIPTRQACTSNFGTQLSATYGRIDGYLVAIVAPTTATHACNADDNHIHLQIKVNGMIYDAAVNTDGNWLERDLALPGAAWSEGWHTTATLDYPTLGLHATDFVTATNATTVLGELDPVNHISVFMTGYGTDGGHLVHREGSSHDGAIVLYPTTGHPHILFFDFSNQTF